MAVLVRAVLFATPVVFFPYLIGSFEAPKAMVVRVAGLALLVAALSGRRARHGLSWSLLDRAVGTWLLIETAATLFARAPLLSLFGEQHQREGLLTSLALAGLYLGARLSIRDRGRLDAIGDAWLVGAAIAGAYALLQAAGLDPAPWRDTATLSGTMRPFGTLGHPNLLGAVTAPAAALSLARALETPVRRRRHLAAAALLAAATLVTLSRAAWLGLAAGAGVAWALQARRARPSGRALWIGAAALASLVVVAVASGWGALFVARLRDMITGAGSAAARLEIWRIALAAFRERPLLGQGPDMLGLAFARLQTPAMWNLEWGRVADHAHSIYLHTLATRGLVGFLVGGACTAALVAGLRAAWRGGEATRAPVAALAAALTALAVTGAFGALGITGAAVTVVLVAGVAALGSSSYSAASTGAGRPRPRAGAHAGGGDRSAAGAQGGARAPRTRHPRPATVAALVVALAMLLWSLNEMSVSYEVRQTLRWLERHPDVRDRETQLAAAVLADRCQLAAKRVPYDDWAPRTLSETLARWAAGWPEPLPLLEQAAAAARAAVDRAPLRSLDHLRLAEALAARVVHGDRGAEAECEAAFQRAATLAPQDAHVLVEWTRARLAFGRPAAALPLASRVVDLYPVSGIAQGALAENHLALGDEAAARGALARALAGNWHGDDGGRRRAEELGRRLGIPP